MKAAVRDRYGPPEVVEVREVDRLRPNYDQVLVRVRAASVNRADLDALGPKPAFARLFMGLRAPRARGLGLDVAGEIEAVGPNVTRFKPGDRVFADLYLYRFGAFAEYVCAREKAFLPIPVGMTFEEAATLPHSAVLAVQGLRLRDGRTIKRGDRVLIDGASGNVGPFAVQIAKARGADVTGVARSEKLNFVRSLGADRVIDYTTTDYTKAGERYDWILDTDSHHSVLAIRHVLNPGGVYVTLGGTARTIVAALLLGIVVSRVTDKHMGMLIWWKPFNPPDVATVTELMAAGAVKPSIDRRFPLAEILDALRWVDDGRARGKVIVVP